MPACFFFSSLCSQRCCILRVEKKWGFAPSVVVRVENEMGMRWQWTCGKLAPKKHLTLGVCLSCGIEWVLWLLGSLRETQAENQLLEILIHVVPWLCLKKTYVINSLNNFRRFRVAVTKFGCNLISTKRCRRSLLLVYIASCWLLSMLFGPSLATDVCLFARPHKGLMVQKAGGLGAACSEIT